MPQFEYADNVTQVFFTEVVFPQLRRGFWTIITLISVHVALVLAICTGFILFSEYTLVSNSWQSVAQLWSPETEEVILNSSMATDKEVREHLKATGRLDVRVGVGSLVEQQRIGLKIS